MEGEISKALLVKFIIDERHKIGPIAKFDPDQYDVGYNDALLKIVSKFLGNKK